jgi:putative restriction endonuclease
MAGAEQVQEPSPTIEREYRLIELRARLHQARFRRVVLAAYRQRCAICELRVRPLLDAAHIVPDSEGGEPHLSNAVGLCVLHHRALDRRVIRISPDYRVRVEPGRIFGDDRAGQEGLMAHDGSHLTLPRARESWPARELLERAFVQ